ncbi:hypothetical protein AVEN_92791-1 [Araneus ventricosus]|uniref:Uncharacterized protein n=1 Tax=Araneus ventricosus TaxID=182803 RepID=A0A4Y2QJL2_ARAVE|nr:hypothetical protein AVEN_92791-1 [Araneus ventricosus]
MLNNALPQEDYKTSYCMFLDSKTLSAFAHAPRGSPAVCHQEKDGFASEHKDKFYRPIEILAAVSSRIQEQLIIPTNIYQLLKSSTEDSGKRKTELLQPQLAIQRTNGELSKLRNGGFGELKRDIERLREDLERLRWQRIPSKNEAVSTEKGSEDIESDVQPESCITENPLKATAYRLADSENKGGHSNTYVSDDELSNDEIISKLTAAWMQSSSTSLLGLSIEGSTTYQDQTV